MAIGAEEHLWPEVPEKRLLDFGRNRLERAVLEIGVEHDQRCSRGVGSPIRKPERLPQPNGVATSNRIDHVRVVGIGHAPPVAAGQPAMALAVVGIAQVASNEAVNDPRGRSQRDRVNEDRGTSTELIERTLPVTISAATARHVTTGTHVAHEIHEVVVLSWLRQHVRPRWTAEATGPPVGNLHDDRMLRGKVGKQWVCGLLGRRELGENLIAENGSLLGPQLSQANPVADAGLDEPCIPAVLDRLPHHRLQQGQRRCAQKLLHAVGSHATCSREAFRMETQGLRHDTISLSALSASAGLTRNSDAKSRFTR